MKGLCYFFEKDPWGHSLIKLIDELKTIGIFFEKIEALRRDAMILDRFYIPTRYPDGLPDITPMEAFCDNDAQLAMRAARMFIDIAMTKIVA